ncbi:MAG: hypothetical protein VR74_05300 [Hyphomonas sp. BRH_c22]|uniref:radical SAM protein n=1 Tax=Hyphomonas sp. BRH_c22 TaxID=1629710 RepID=UPI0005F2508F|nr:radical SAM protein [Hyphomonas sp. BRH_c22]KJS38586.1 MAG: hypothetical protein VR74_05300 [Hyphomonas sp. BRH_c22]
MTYGPIEMVVLQGTSYCNLNCNYCYLSEASRRDARSMSIDTIEAAFRAILKSQFLGHKLRVSWHSGEPFVMKSAYYRQAITAIDALVRNSSREDLQVDFDFQTNGTLVNDAWVSFFKEYEGRATLGISCDGPAALHDRHRKNWSGKTSHAATENGMRMLGDAGIDFDITAVVSPDGLDRPDEFIAYFEPFSDSIREFHFNLHDEFFISSGDTDLIESYAARYQQFLTRLIETLSAPGRRHPKIRNFSSFYNRLFVPESDRPRYDARSMCEPFKTVSIELNGDVTTFYAGLTLDECRDLKNLYGDNLGFVVGNILNQSLDEIAASSKLKKIEHDFETSHSACERSCEYFDVCSGGYNLIKYRRFGSFDSTETPECRVHVKAFADTVLAHLEDDLNVRNSAAE